MAIDNATRKACEAYLRKMKKGELKELAEKEDMNMKVNTFFFNMSRRLVKQGWTAPVKENKRGSRSRTPVVSKKNKNMKVAAEPEIVAKKGKKASKKAVEEPAAAVEEPEEAVEEDIEADLVNSDTKKRQLVMIACGLGAVLVALLAFFFHEEIWHTVQMLTAPIVDNVITPVVNFVHPAWAFVAHYTSAAWSYVCFVADVWCSAVCDACSTVYNFVAGHLSAVTGFVGTYTGMAREQVMSVWNAFFYPQAAVVPQAAAPVVEPVPVAPVQ